MSGYIKIYRLNWMDVLSEKPAFEISFSIFITYGLDAKVGFNDKFILVNIKHDKFIHKLANPLW